MTHVRYNLGWKRERGRYVGRVQYVLNLHWTGKRKRYRSAGINFWSVCFRGCNAVTETLRHVLLSHASIFASPLLHTHGQFPQFTNQHVPGWENLERAHTIKLHTEMHQVHPGNQTRGPSQTENPGDSANYRTTVPRHKMYVGSNYIRGDDGPESITLR